MRKEDFKDWTSDRLIDEIINLTEKNFNLEWRIKQFEESEGRWKCENKSLRDENKALKRIVENFEVELKSKIDNPKLHKEIIRLQDQHQQNCIRYNDMRTAYLVTLDELARLREQFGVGR